MIRACLMVALAGLALCQGQLLPDPVSLNNCESYCELFGNNYYCCDEQSISNGGRPGKCPRTPISPEEIELLVLNGNHNLLNCQQDNDCEPLEKCCYPKEETPYRICRLIGF